MAMRPKRWPLSLVARLEEVDREKIEFSNGQNVVQYRGQLMPLVTIDGVKELSGEGRQPVLVFFRRWAFRWAWWSTRLSTSSRKHLTVELTNERAGYLGSAVIDGKGHRHRRCRLFPEHRVQGLVRQLGSECLR